MNNIKRVAISHGNPEPDLKDEVNKSDLSSNNSEEMLGLLINAGENDASINDS
jgi:hypothetical protein